MNIEHSCARSLLHVYSCVVEWYDDDVDDDDGGGSDGDDDDG